MKSYVIGIAGGTGSGKTTVAQEIVAAFPRKDVSYVSFDHYYKDLSHLPKNKRKLINFDHPDSLESKLLISHVRNLKNGQSIRQPIYDFVTHTRLSQTIVLKSAPVIIIEGILTFVYPELRKLLDIKIFVDTEPDIRFIRRLQRDIKDRGRTIENVITQYLQTVQPMHLEFVEPSKRYADIIIPEGRNDPTMHALISLVKDHVSF